ncbi:MAG: Rieske (2Fe-2S) protein [Vicinamibacterales bacterium]
MSTERRRFLGALPFLGALLAVGTSSVGALLAVPLARFAMHPLRRKPGEVAWSDIGPTADLTSLAAPMKMLVEVEQRDGWRKMISTKPVYVTRTAEGRLRVLSAVCPHLGCSVAWNESQKRFLCPCHVGVFAEDGALVSGPPPRGMDELDSTVEDGRLKVRYQYFRQLVPTREIIA